MLVGPLVRHTVKTTFIHDIMHEVAVIRDDTWNQNDQDDHDVHSNHEYPANHVDLANHDDSANQVDLANNDDSANYDDSAQHDDSPNRDDFANLDDFANHGDSANQFLSANHANNSLNLYYAKLSTLIQIFCSCYYFSQQAISSQVENG